MNGCIGQARIKGMQKQLILIMEDCALCCDISTYLVKMVCYFSYLRIMFSYVLCHIVDC